MHLFVGIAGPCSYLCHEFSGVWANYESYCEIEHRIQGTIKVMIIHLILYKGCLVFQFVRMMSVPQICRIYIYGREGVLDVGIRTVHTGHPKKLPHDNRTIDPEYLKYHLLNKNSQITNLTYAYQSLDSSRLRCMYVEYSRADMFRQYYAFRIKLQYVEMPFYHFSLDKRQREYKGSMKMFLGKIVSEGLRGVSVKPITITIAAKYVSDEIRLHKRDVSSLMSFKVYYSQENCSFDDLDTIAEILTKRVDARTGHKRVIYLRLRMNISTELLFFETTYDELTFIPSSIPQCDIFLEYRMTVLVKLDHPQSISCYQSHQTAIQVRSHIPLVLINVTFIAKAIRVFFKYIRTLVIISLHAV